MHVSGPSNLNDCMRLWFVQQAGEDDALWKLLFACCQHLRRVMAKNHTMIANMESLRGSDVIMQSLNALSKTQRGTGCLLFCLFSCLRILK